MALPDRIRYYLKNSMAGTPAVLDSLLGYFPNNSGFWDYRPVAERFTPREALAHLADWDVIHGERLERMLSEDRPTLPDVDEGKLAQERDYGSQEPGRSLARFAENRLTLHRAFECVEAADWERTGIRITIGELSVADMATMILAHDGYHLRQISEYLHSWRRI